MLRRNLANYFLLGQMVFFLLILVAFYFGIPLVPCIFREATLTGKCAGYNGAGIAIVVWNCVFSGTLLMVPSFFAVEILQELSHVKKIGRLIKDLAKKVDSKRSLVEWNALLWGIEDQKSKDDTGSYGRMLTVLLLIAFTLSLFVFFYNLYQGPIFALIVQIYVITIYIDVCCLIVLFVAVNLENIYTDAAGELFKTQVVTHAKKNGDSLLDNVCTHSIISFWSDKHFTVKIPIWKDSINISLSKEKFYSLLALAGANIANTILALVNIHI